MTTISTDLQKLLDNTHGKENIHFVLPGAVVSGKPSVDNTPETICLHLATVFTGASKTEIAKLLVPIDKIIAFGSGDIESA